MEARFLVDAPKVKQKNGEDLQLSKAWNARIILIWLTDVVQRTVGAHDFNQYLDDGRWVLARTALTLELRHVGGASRLIVFPIFFSLRTSMARLFWLCSVLGFIKFWPIVPIRWLDLLVRLLGFSGLLQSPKISTVKDASSWRPTKLSVPSPFSSNGSSS